MLAKREIETWGRLGEGGIVRRISGVPLPLSNTQKKALIEGQHLWRSTTFPNCGSGLIPRGPWLSAGFWLQAAVSLFSGSLKHSSSLSWSWTIRCLVTKWPLSSIFNISIHPIWVFLLHNQFSKCLKNKNCLWLRLLPICASTVDYGAIYH